MARDRGAGASRRPHRRLCLFRIAEMGLARGRCTGRMRSDRRRARCAGCGRRRSLPGWSWYWYCGSVALLTRAVAVPPVDPAGAAPPPEALPADFRDLARRSGEPRIPGLEIVYLHPLGMPESANKWQNIIVHQTEGPAGSAREPRACASEESDQARCDDLGGDRRHGLLVDGRERDPDPRRRRQSERQQVYRQLQDLSHRGADQLDRRGVRRQFSRCDQAGDPEQTRAWLVLVRFLQERYDIPAESIYAHNWIDFKDRRYCEGCELATLARELGYRPGITASR